MPLPDDFISLARAHAHRRKLKFKRGNAVADGWSMLGSGFFGEAWEHADYPELVVKVSGRGGFGLDDAYTVIRLKYEPCLDSWQVYAQYCHKHPHKHLPNIMHFERINAAAAWAIMPKYKLYHDTPGHYTRMRWHGWLNGERNAPEWMWPIIGMASSLCLEVDLHSENVMIDSDGTMIMTDPFSGLVT